MNAVFKVFVNKLMRAAWGRLSVHPNHVRSHKGQYKWGIRSHRKRSWFRGNGTAMDSHTFTCRRKKNVGMCALVLLHELMFDRVLVCFLTPCIVFCLIWKHSRGLTLWIIFAPPVCAVVRLFAWGCLCYVWKTCQTIRAFNLMLCDWMVKATVPLSSLQYYQKTGSSPK